MKFLSIFAALAFAFSPAAFVMAADEASAAAPSDAKSELESLVNRITEKIKAGTEPSEKEFSSEIKEFDGIIARHKDEKADVLAEVMLMKAALYFQLLDEVDKAVPILKDIEKKYPETKPGKAAAQMLSVVERQQAAAKIQAALKVGAPFPPFEEKDIKGKPFSLAALKGKVTLVDFWATWCGPCVAELPDVLAAYKKYHDKGFAIAGISLDEDRSALDSFLKERGVTWPQYFDGKGWENVLAEKYGIMSIPATFLLNEKGIIIGRDLRGSELDKALGKALGSD